jgi:aldehyde dehydrogenase (NAD+)
MNLNSSQNFIAGKWVDPIDGATLPMIEPATGQAFGNIADSASRDVDTAVRAARQAFDEGAWGRTTATERGRMLARFGELVLSKAAELAALEAKDTGKPKSAADADIVALARYFEFYAGAADKHHGEIVPYLNGYHVGVMHEPHGVTGHILPWNYPAQMFGRTLAPSLAVGNATVLKPAEDACASSLRLVELAVEAGFPDGAINIVTGKGQVAGAALCSHAGVDFMSFTGSPEVGQLIQKLCADHYISCTLELGGKSPQVVFADADLDAAIPVIEKSMYGAFAERLAAAFAKVRVGAPEMNLDCGPIITAKQQKRVQTFIDRARHDGIAVLSQGRLADGLASGGFYVVPTVFAPVPRTNVIAHEEVFGPVLTVLPFEDEPDAVRLANATDYGLVAAVWTRDGARQMRMVKRLRAGQVFVNCFGAGAGIELPFGGSGKSGHGREKGFSALRDFSKTKTMVVNHG